MCLREETAIEEGKLLWLPTHARKAMLFQSEYVKADNAIRYEPENKSRETGRDASKAGMLLISSAAARLGAAVAKS